MIRDSARDGHFIMVLTESELRAVQSGDHLARVLERKRQRQFQKLHAMTLSLAEIEALVEGIAPVDGASSPARNEAAGVLVEASAGFVSLGGGLGNIAKAMRQTREAALKSWSMLPTSSTIAISATRSRLLRWRSLTLNGR